MKQHLRTPADIGLQYQDLFFESKDGTKLHAWFLPAKNRAKGSILFLHGNAENISTHIGSVYWLPENGFNVLLFDYRGYGHSEGTPTQQGVYLDAEAALGKLISMPGINELPIIIYGQSLGAAISSYTAAYSQYKAEIDAVIIESGFNSYRNIAREKLNESWLTWLFQYPLAYTISDSFSPLEAVPDITPTPLLLIYSQQDRVIPADHGQRLFDAAKQPKQLWFYEEGHHIGIFQQPERRQRLLDYLYAVTDRQH